MEGVEHYNKTIRSILLITLNELREYGKDDVQKYSVQEFLMYACLLGSDHINIGDFCLLKNDPLQLQIQAGVSDISDMHLSLGEVCSDEFMRNELTSTLVKYSLLKPQNAECTEYRFHLVMQAVMIDEIATPEVVFAMAHSLWLVFFDEWFYKHHARLLLHLCTLSKRIADCLPLCDKLGSKELVAEWEANHVVMDCVHRIYSIWLNRSIVKTEQEIELGQKIIDALEKLGNQLAELDLKADAFPFILALRAYTESLHQLRAINNFAVTDCLSKAIDLAIRLLEQDIPDNYTALLTREIHSLCFNTGLLIQEWLYSGKTNITIPLLEDYTNLIGKRIDQRQELLTHEDYRDFSETVNAWLTHDVEQLPDSAKEIINIRVEKGVLPKNEAIGDNGVIVLSAPAVPPRFTTRSSYVN